MLLGWCRRKRQWDDGWLWNLFRLGVPVRRAGKWWHADGWRLGRPRLQWQWCARRPRLWRGRREGQPGRRWGWRWLLRWRWWRRMLFGRWRRRWFELLVGDRHRIRGGLSGRRRPSVGFDDSMTLFQEPWGGGYSL